MTQDLLDVLVPLVLLGYWAFLVVNARDNEVVPTRVLAWIRYRLTVERIVVQFDANVEPFRKAIETAQVALGKFYEDLLRQGAAVAEALAKEEGE